MTNKVTKTLENFLKTSAKAKGGFKSSLAENAKVDKEFEKIVAHLDDLITRLGKESSSKSATQEEKVALRGLANTTASLIEALKSKDRSIDTLQASLIEFQKSNTKLAAILKEEDKEAARLVNEKVLKEIADGLEGKVAKAFAESQKKVNRATAGVKKTGAFGAASDLLMGGIFGAAGKDMADLFGVEEKLEKMFAKTLGHRGRKARRAAQADIAGLQEGASDTLEGRQAAARAKIAADANSDFQRETIDTNRAIADTLGDVARNTGGGLMSGLFSTFFGKGSFIVKALMGMGSAIAGLLGLKSLFGGGGGVDLPDIDVDTPDGKRKPKPKAPKGGGRLSKLFKGAKSLGSKVLPKLGSIGSKALPWLGRGALSVLSSPAASVAGAAYTGYEVGSYLDGKFNLSGKLADAAMSATEGVGKAWESAKGFMSGGESVADIIKKAAERTGVDYGTMMAFAKQESGFNPSAKAKTSSASGLFQFIGSTWKNMVAKYGSTFGIGEGDVMDPLANATMGAMYIKENSNFLRKNGIPINGTTLYAAHFLGPGGAAKLFGADQNADATALMPAAAKANPGIFKNKDGSAKTVAEVQQTLFNKVGKNVDEFAAHANAQGTGVSTASAAPARAKAGDNMPQVAQSAPLTTATSTSNPSTSSTPTTTIDEIPMYVNEMGLVMTSVGGLI